MGTDLSSIPSISIGDYTLEVVEGFACLGSTISRNLSLNAKLKIQIGKTVPAMACLAKRVWENSMLTTNTKMKVYQACVLSTLLYGSEAWTLYSCQECRLNAFHLCYLRKILDITWQDHVPNKNVLTQAGIPSMFPCLPKGTCAGLVMSAACRMAKSPKTYCMVNFPLAPDLQKGLFFTSKTSVNEI